LNNPRLLAISGAHKEAVALVKGRPLILGRDPSNEIEVSDAAVSRRHCAVSEVSDGVFEIADLDSHNGTLVNQARITRKILRHGDRILIGHCEFVFLTGPEDEAALLEPIREGNANATLTTMPLNRKGMPSDDAWIGRMAGDLAALFKIANVINSTRDMQALQSDLLALICEVVPAAQGTIVLQPHRDEEPDPPSVWNRKGESDQPIVLRDELVRQAMWERCAVASAATAETVGGEHVLCVPLVAVEKTLGVIYLTAPASSAPFGEDHVYFVSSVSRIAAVTLENLLKLDSLRAENQRLRAAVVAAEGSLIGESKAMRRVTEFIARVAQGDSTVLIRGESGTGKELVARAIHASSPRAGEPFIAINCAAIPEALLESELFGHEKGAFTGASGLRKGKLEAAEDGTVFLDEIGEMAPLLQAKLLRVLQQREFERLGGNRLLAFNARVLAATNKNLEQAIKSGEFRADLHYRLNVVSVALPALREHREDIPPLALYFVNKYAAKCKRSFKGIAAEARSLLMQYSWPGNVRELENAIEHAVVLVLTDEILPEDLPSTLLEERSAELPAARYHNTLNETKKQLVLSALDEAKSSPIEAARILGIHPKYLHRLIRNLNLKSEGKRLA
jgi:transcriptional regulator with GAF, ATPase, and Fis domain